MHGQCGQVESSAWRQADAQRKRTEPMAKARSPVHVAKWNLAHGGMPTSLSTLGVFRRNMHNLQHLRCNIANWAFGSAASSCLRGSTRNASKWGRVGQPIYIANIHQRANTTMRELSRSFGPTVMMCTSLHVSNPLPVQYKERPLEPRGQTHLPRELLPEPLTCSACPASSTPASPAPAPAPVPAIDTLGRFASGAGRAPPGFFVPAAPLAPDEAPLVCANQETLTMV